MFLFTHNFDYCIVIEYSVYSMLYLRYRVRTVLTIVRVVRSSSSSSTVVVVVKYSTDIVAHIFQNGYLRTYCN